MNPYQNDPNNFPPRPVEVEGTLILVLGILSLVFCQICGPVAWIMGNNSLAQLDAARIYDGTERTMVSIGRVLGIIGTVFLVFGCCFFGIWLALAGTAFVGGVSTQPHPF